MGLIVYTNATEYGPILSVWHKPPPSDRLEEDRPPEETALLVCVSGWPLSRPGCLPTGPL